MTNAIKQTKSRSSAQPAEEKDILVSFFSNIWKSCKKHKEAVLTALVILVIAWGLCYAYSAYAHQRTEKSWAAYYQAQMTLMSGNESEGLQLLDKLTADFSNTPAANYGQLLKADILYSNENYAQAADVYKTLVKANNEMVRTVASLSLAASLQATKDYAGSVEAASQFIAHNSQNFALPQAYLTLAMSQELAGNKQEAIDAYKYLLENYTKTYFGVVANDKINALQKQN